MKTTQNLNAKLVLYCLFIYLNFQQSYFFFRKLKNEGDLLKLSHSQLLEITELNLDSQRFIFVNQIIFILC